MVVSGGEDSIVMAFKWPGEGERLARIDHHRGPVTSLAINNRQDVLVSGSQDGSICVWSLDDWSLLNVISVGQAVGHVTLSSDDVFLLAVGLDDRLPRLFSLTTGSPLRTWTDLSIKVASFSTFKPFIRNVFIETFVLGGRSGDRCGQRALVRCSFGGRRAPHVLRLSRRPIGSRSVD